MRPNALYRAMLDLELALVPLGAESTARSGPAVEAALDRSDASALADLQMHWDEAYVIGLDGEIWSARFRDSTDELRAHTSTELRELIRADYSYRAKVQPADDALGEEDGSDGDPSDGERDDDARHKDGDRDEEDDMDGTLPQQPEHVSLATIRGERMST